MKKIFFALLLLPFAALSQPSFDTVSRGIHTITTRVCGYSKYGDSTGLVLDEYREYNVRGQEVKFIGRDKIYSISEVDMDEEEKEPDSWFYDGYKDGDYRNKKREYDTVRYQYNSKFQQIKYSSRNDGTAIKHIYSYDANGNCILDVFYSDGKEEFRLEWKYNAYNERVSETRTNAGDKPRKTAQYYYDEKHRLTAEVSLWGSAIDSTAYVYSAAGKTKTVFHSSGSFDRDIFDIHDSLVSSVRYYAQGSYRDDKRVYLFDSTSIVRNEAGFAMSYYQITNYAQAPEIVTRTFDGKGRCLEELTLRNGKKSRKKTSEYNDELHTVIVKRYGFHYETNKLSPEGKEALKEEDIYVHDNNGRLIETRYYDGHTKLLERDICTYTMY